MTWATKRRFIVAIIGMALIAAVVAIVLIPTLYQSPSCSDQRQNQGEQGIDCGGPCAYLCAALQQMPVVRFTKAVYPTKNRVDVVSYVENVNINIAARRVPYTVTLYASDQTVLRKTKGTLDLFPSRRTPVFMPAFFTGTVSGTRAFLTIDAPDDSKWFTYTDTPRLPTVENPTVGGTTAAPRITATVTNNGIAPLGATKLVVVVYDASRNIIAASQTLTQSLASQQSALVTFTWSEPFSSAPARIEVEPVPTFGP